MWMINLKETWTLTYLINHLLLRIVIQSHIVMQSVEEAMIKMKLWKTIELLKLFLSKLRKKLIKVLFMRMLKWKNKIIMTRSSKLIQLKGFWGFGVLGFWGLELYISYLFLIIIIFFK